MNYDHVAYSKRVNALLSDAGAVVESYGEVGGYPLMGYSLLREDPDSEEILPLVYLSAGMHGDEPAGPESLLTLLEDGLLDREMSFLICPMLNPEGFGLGTRENASGRDMNRDYFYLRNVEVQGHVKWLENKFESRVPDLFIKPTTIQRDG